MKSCKTFGLLLVVVAICGCRPPSNEKQLVTRAGVLGFRIAPTLPGTAHDKTLALTKTEYKTYMSRLDEQGPPTTGNANDKYLWFPVHNKCRSIAPGLVVGEHAGKKYVLLYNQTGYTMLNDPGNPSWSVSSAYRVRDAMGKPAVGFNLDKRGAKLMVRLTGAHKGHFIAVLLDDEVYSAPVLRSTIYHRGVIEGNFTVQEVDELIRILEGRPLPSSN